MMLNRPGDQPGPFTPAELDGVDGIAPDELAADRRVARELEGVADRGTVRPSTDFAERVMAAIAAEPAPAPIRAAGAAVRRRSPGALLASFRDAWRVSFGTGFPLAARAQALALVLVVGGALATSGVVTAGALGAFTNQGTGPAPTQATDAPVITSEPTPAPTTAPTEPTGPTNGSLEPAEIGSPEATATPSAEPTESEAPGGTPEATSGDGGSSETHGGPTSRPTRAPGASDRPTEAPTNEPEDRGTPQPSETPQPTEAPHTWGPTPTPAH
jgi:hypothetical protein